MVNVYRNIKVISCGGVGFRADGDVDLDGLEVVEAKSHGAEFKGLNTRAENITIHHAGGDGVRDVFSDLRARKIIPPDLSDDEFYRDLRAVKYATKNERDEIIASIPWMSTLAAASNGATVYATWILPMIQRFLN